MKSEFISSVICVIVNIDYIFSKYSFAINIMIRSIVEYCGEHESYKCGYCKKPDTNFSHGMWAHYLTVGDYQALIDRGWRRSGKYCYKPSMDATCCPMYTIRCRALEFKTSKSQKKVLNRFNKYLMGQLILDQPSNVGASNMSTRSSSLEIVNDDCGQGGEQFVESTKSHQDINISEMVLKSNQSESSEQAGSSITNTGLTNTETPQIDMKKHKTLLKGSGPDPSKSPCKKAKQLRLERKLEKLKEKGIDITTLSNKNKNKEKQVEDFLNDLPDEMKNKLEIHLVRTSPPSAAWCASSKATHDLYVKYQTIIHNDKPYKCTESKFKDFLVSSPLLEEYPPTGPPCGFGSFHQQYWLEGKLIAVGVIDILPKCVSSVYFFYDPQYMNLTLGTYGALREIAFTRHLNSECSELKYYYMGFYIHSCPKMRYKGNFHPSDLLCPETYKWFSIKDCIPKLEVSPYSRFDSDLDSVDDDFPNKGDIKNIPLWVNGKIILYKTVNTGDEEVITEYSQLVGSKTCKSLVLIR